MKHLTNTGIIYIYIYIYIYVCDIYIAPYSARSCFKALYNIIYNIIIPDSDLLLPSRYLNSHGRIQRMFAIIGAKRYSNT